MRSGRYYSVKPGEVILNSKEPFAVEYRRELKSYLDEYPKGRDKNDLKRRLRSYTESGFYSACFELFLHHLLINRCDTVTLHPLLSSVTTRPDFKATHRLGDLFLEATLALESEEYQAQEQRLRELVDAIRDVRGNVVVWAQPATHLPEGFPLDSVRDFLKCQIDGLDPTSLELPQTLRFEASFNDYPVIIDFEVIGATEEGCDSVVQAWGSPEAKAVTTHLRIRRRVGLKAAKYGDISIPYVVAVWPRTEFPLTEEGALSALYGDRQIQVSRNPPQVVRERRAWNGTFNTVVKSNLLNREVSAVGLYREQFLETSCERSLYVYHNPFAYNHIPEEVFSDLPQFVFREVGDENRHMQWLSGISPWG